MTDTDELRIADGYTAMPYGDGYIIHHESGGAWAADLAMVAAVLEIARLRAQLQTLGLCIAEALPTLDTVEPECSTEAELLTALIRRGEMLVLASLARGGALGPNAELTGTRRP